MTAWLAPLRFMDMLYLRPRAQRKFLNILKACVLHRSRNQKTSPYRCYSQPDGIRDRKAICSNKDCGDRGRESRHCSGLPSQCGLSFPMNRSHLNMLPEAPLANSEGLRYRSQGVCIPKKGDSSSLAFLRLWVQSQQRK